MGESSQNENLILIEKNQTNENDLYTEEHVEILESENVQTKNNRVEENEEKLQKLHVQIFFWKGHNMNSLCWAIYCVNDGKEVEVTSHQVMRCILCYHNVVNILSKN
jgi:ribosomal protein L4